MALGIQQQIAAAEKKTSSKGSSSSSNSNSKGMSGFDKELLATCLFVHSSILISDSIETPLGVIDAAFKMGISDWRLHRLRAQLNCFTLNRMDENAAPKAERINCTDNIIADCDFVIRVAPPESSGELTTTFTKAYVLRNHPNDSKRYEAIGQYQRYLDLAEKDDRHHAAAHFHLGLSLMLVFRRMATEVDRGAVKAAAREEYQKGVAAEEARLPFFLPPGQQSKQALCMLLAGTKASSPGLTERDLAAAMARDEMAIKQQAEKAARRAAAAAEKERARSKRESKGV